MSIFVLSFYWNFPLLILAKLCVWNKNQITCVFYSFTASKVIIIDVYYCIHFLSTSQFKLKLYISECRHAYAIALKRGFRWKHQQSDTFGWLKFQSRTMTIDGVSSFAHFHNKTKKLHFFDITHSVQNCTHVHCKVVFTIYMYNIVIFVRIDRDHRPCNFHQ